MMVYIYHFFGGETSMSLSCPWNTGIPARCASSSSGYLILLLQCLAANACTIVLDLIYTQQKEMEFLSHNFASSSHPLDGHIGQLIIRQKILFLFCLSLFLSFSFPPSLSSFLLNNFLNIFPYKLLLKFFFFKFFVKTLSLSFQLFCLTHMFNANPDI